jgi:hypothetical protein
MEKRLAAKSGSRFEKRRFLDHSLTKGVKESGRELVIVELPSDDKSIR